MPVQHHREKDPSDAGIHGHDRAGSLPSESDDRIGHEDSGQGGRLQGILDIGYRYDARDGRYKLLDANPRLGATFRLFVGDNGMDVTRAEYLHFTGQPVPVSHICTGRKWILEDADLVSCIQYYRDGVTESARLAWELSWE